MEEIITRFGFEGNEVLSIGDRFQTDIQPALMVGGDGVLVDGPGSIDYVYDDWCKKRLQTRAGIYQLFMNQGNMKCL